jgi:hypothetical protein
MLHIAQERGGCLQAVCHVAHHAAGQKLHAHKDSAFGSARPRHTSCRTLRRGVPQIVSASPLNEGSTDADVRAVRESGEQHMIERALAQSLHCILRHLFPRLTRILLSFYRGSPASWPVLLLGMWVCLSM